MFPQNGNNNELTQNRQPLLPFEIMLFWDLFGCTLVPGMV